MKLPLIGSSYSAFSVAAAAQQSLNCYLESIEAPEGKNKFALRGRPGWRLFKNLTTINGSATPLRGVWSGAGRLFVAAGTKQFEVDSSGALVGSVHTIADDAVHSPVQFFPNGNQLFWVSAGTAYCDNGAGPVAITLPTLSGKATSLPVGGIFYLSWSPSANSSTGNTDGFDIGMAGQAITFNGAAFTVDKVLSNSLLTLTTTPGIHADKDWSCTPAVTASTGTAMDGYFIVARLNSKQFNISPLFNGMGDAGDGKWNALDSDFKSGYPDNLMAVWAEPPLLYLLGTESLEIWRDTGNADFPFQRVDGGFARIGLAATWSPCSIAGKLHMLAGGTYGQTVAVRMEGITPVRISTHAVEEALASNVWSGGNGVSWSYVDRGHWFWVIGLAGGNAQVYDATESARLGEPQWHERAMWDNTGKVFSPYKPWFHTFIPEWGNGKHIVGDYTSGKLYEMSSDFGDDDNTDIRGVRALTHLWNGGNRMYMSRIEAEMETGLATGTQLTFDWSDDRGHNFHAPRTMLTDVSGAYQTRAVLRRLGGFYDRVPRLSFQGRSKIALIDLNAELDMGSR